MILCASHVIYCLPVLSLLFKFVLRLCSVHSSDGLTLPLFLLLSAISSNRDLGTQSSQLLSLQPELAHFPGRMLIHSILPAVSRLCLAAPNLWVYAMPLHAELAKLLPEDKYMYYAGPYLGE